MPTPLNARAILSVNPTRDDINRCVGTTLKNVQCKHVVSWEVDDDLAQAGRLLDTLTTVEWCQSHPRQLLRILKEIASKTLCQRTHRWKQTNVDDVADRWFAVIQTLRIRPVSRRRPITPPTTDEESNDEDDNSHDASPSDDSSDDLPPRPRRRTTRNTININSDVVIHLDHQPRRNAINIDNHVNIPPRTRPDAPRRRDPRPPSPDTDSHTSSSRASSSNSSYHTATQSPGSRGSQVSTSSSSSHTLSAHSSNSQTHEDLRRRIRELEAQVEELRNQSSRASTPASSRRSSFHRENAPSVSSDSSRRNYGVGTSTIVPASRSSNSTSTRPATLAQRSNAFMVGRSLVPFVPIKKEAVRRKPITTTTECYVCYKRIRNKDQATWCRGGCGQNICHGCFDDWEDVQNGLVKCCFW